MVKQGNGCLETCNMADERAGIGRHSRECKRSA